MTPTDIPQLAYLNTLRALDAFDATTAEYRTLLDAQRALLAERNYSGVEVMVYRGDRLARDARAYGQQLSAVQKAMLQHPYQGPRADELQQRISAAQKCAQEISAVVAELSALCSQAKSSAAKELESPMISRQGFSPQRRYNTGQYRAMVFDTVR
jgi:hypothetical protein